MKYYFDRYIDTALYLMTVLCVIGLMITTIQLKNEVYDMQEQLIEMAEEMKAQVDTEKAISQAVEGATSAAMVNADKEDAVEEAPLKTLYTDADAVALARLVWGEARGVPEYFMAGRSVSTRDQQAAVMWTVLNRFDAGYSDSIIGVITAKGQFCGYSTGHPVEEELLDLAYDVLDRWNAEKNGKTVERELPIEYLWFRGDGTYNYFRDAYQNGRVYAWEG